MKYMFAIVLFVISTLVASAQNFKEDIKKMYGAYQNAESFYTEIKVEAFHNSLDERPKFSKKAIVQKQGKKYLYKLDDMTTLINSKYQVATIGAKKMMIVQDVEEEPVLENMLVQNLDSLLDKNTKITYKGIVDGQKCYQILQPEGSMISKVELYLAPSTYFLTKMIYWTDSKVLNQQGIVVSTFKGTTTKPVFNEDTFSERQFFSKKQGKYIPAVAYKNFEIINTSDYDIQE
ncbi:MAG: hypothetical protein GC192_20955 [Bacteroidetes bacterium]|nr:hypothetical protein [Bacteroidota bacterium]